MIFEIRGGQINNDVTYFLSLIYSLNPNSGNVQFRLKQYTCFIPGFRGNGEPSTSPWLGDGEEGQRILKVIADAEDEIEAWNEHLAQVLTFPIDAEVNEPQDRGPLHDGDCVQVKDIAGADDLYSVLVNVTRGRERFVFPLCDLAVRDKKSPNYRPVFGDNFSQPVKSIHNSRITMNFVSISNLASCIELLIRLVSEDSPDPFITDISVHISHIYG